MRFKSSCNKIPDSTRPEKNKIPSSLNFYSHRGGISSLLAFATGDLDSIPGRVGNLSALYLDNLDTHGENSSCLNGFTMAALRGGTE